MKSPLPSSALRRGFASTLSALSIATPFASAQVCSGGRTELLSQLPDYTNGFKSDATPNPQIVADQAQIPAGFVLESVTVWGGFAPGNNATNDFTLIVHADDGSGLPGSVAYSESGIATSLVLTGLVFPPPLIPLNEYRATLTPSAPVSLPTGTVWFEVYNDASGGDAWHWLTGTLDPQSGVGASAIAFNAPGGPWFMLNPDMALVVCGSDGGVGTTLCYGDDTGTSCPCFNQGGTGAGCANSTGFGASLAASGSASVSAGDLVLHGSNLLPGQPGLFFQGNVIINGGAGVAFGDGIRCCGQNVQRIQVVFPDANGQASTTDDIASDGGAAPGDSRCYQLWYRDPSGSPCGTNFNLTNALSLTWLP